ncbi:antibiotic biosynthesis monooxygenase [Streptomyces venezuelae]|uniref:antibiotic biosynthesis monooxygenase family protein n=1 Tax=Streptomyces venezuelae TaxID=54571 RepID=UPI00123DA658|nr:antibiotic biosynthesis monooxygenase family protein [Streptomyces venezuelae]QES12240.1 antibiotic biosynthesis monooxygenase [Streptomyces venezuelae]
MPLINPEDGYLTVFNLFETETYDGQARVVDEMKDIVDNATYPGWISSTVHAGVDTPGTLNYIQWRSLADLEARYQGQKFQKKTVPLFDELATSVKLLKTELVHAQHHPDLGAAAEVSPERDDYAVFILFEVKPDQQQELLDTLAKPDEWIKTVPGYRSHGYYRGIDGTYVVNYAQWESKELYEAFHTLPEEQRPADIREGRLRARSLVTSRWANSFRAVHSRSAE